MSGEHFLALARHPTATTFVDCADGPRHRTTDATQTDTDRKRCNRQGQLSRWSHPSSSINQSDRTEQNGVLRRYLRGMPFVHPQAGQRQRSGWVKGREGAQERVIFPCSLVSLSPPFSFQFSLPSTLTFHVLSRLFRSYLCTDLIELPCFLPCLASAFPSPHSQRRKQ